MGVPFTTFVNTLVAKVRPEGKLVTAAVAQYIQAGVQDDALTQLDIVNVTISGPYERSVTERQACAQGEAHARHRLS
jgi:chitinase